MAYNTKLYKSTGSGWDEVRVASEWGLIANKPSTFTPTAHSHPEYVKTSGNQTITGIKQIDNSDLRMNGGSVSYLRPVTTGGWARGFWWQKNATDDVPYQRIGGIGVLGNNLSVSKFYIGYGESPWINSILEAFPDYVNINGTLRTIATTDSDSDNTVATKGYVDSKISVALVEGLLDENNKIKASLLPSFVLGSMRFVTTWEDTENNSLEHLHTNVIDPYITSNGGSTRGCYVIVTRTMQVSVSNGYSLYMDETEGVSDPLPISAGQITIERGDWLICISDDGKTWAILNNVYRDATIGNKGIVQLAKEEEGVEGTSTTLAMTPKSTAAAINETLGDIDTALSSILGA